MAIHVSRGAWWLFGAVFVLAPLTDQVVKGMRSSALERASDDIDPQVRWIGNVEDRFEEVAEAVQSRRTFRDIEFYINDAGIVEIIASASTTPLEIGLFSPDTRSVGTMKVPANSQVRLEMSVGPESRNRIRLRRVSADAAPAQFQLRMRRLSATPAGP
jgi:hypothetical protein